MRHRRRGALRRGTDAAERCDAAQTPRSVATRHIIDCRVLSGASRLLLPTLLAAGPLTAGQITVFLLAFGVLLGTARLFGEIARRFGQPTVLGEILAGVVLGATVLGNPALMGGEDGVNVRVYRWLFPTYVLDADLDPVQIAKLADQRRGRSRSPCPTRRTPPALMCPVTVIDPDATDDSNPLPANVEAPKPPRRMSLPSRPNLRPPPSRNGVRRPSGCRTGRRMSRPADPRKPTSEPADGAKAYGAKAYDAGYIVMSMFLSLSAVLLLLVAGLEVDLSVVWKQGKAAAWVSLLGMAVPFALGFALAYWLPNQIGYDVSSDKLVPFALFLGIAMSITALPVIAKILLDLNLFRTDLGMLIMSSAMINDLLGWIGFAMVLALVAAPPEVVGQAAEAGQAAGPSLGLTVALTLLFVGGMLTGGRWLANKVLPFVQAHTSWPGGVLAFVMVVALVSAAFTEHIGIHSIFGAFIAGVAIGDSRHLRKKTREVIEQFISNIFAPLFFAGIGLRVNFIEGFDLTAVALVFVVAMAGKIIGCYFGAKWAGLPKRQSAAVGFGMTARGAMEIILAQLAMSHGLITEKLFVAIVVMAIATSLLAGPLMQLALKQKQKRKLTDLISEKSFAGQLRSAHPQGAIRELAAVAAKVTGLDAQLISDNAWAREQVVPTGVGQGLALPHARMEGLDKPRVIIGQSNAGIDFDAPDGVDAEIICLLLSPADNPDAHLEMLAATAEAFSIDDARRMCLNAENYTELRAALVTSADTGSH